MIRVPLVTFLFCCICIDDLLRLSLHDILSSQVAVVGQRTDDVHFFLLVVIHPDQNTQASPSLRRQARTRYAGYTRLDCPRTEGEVSFLACCPFGYIGTSLVLFVVFIPTLPHSLQIVERSWKYGKQRPRTPARDSVHLRLRFGLAVGLSWDGLGSYHAA
jgi:hypothetical protein